MAMQLHAHEDQFSSMAKQIGKWIDNVLGPGYKRYSPKQAWSPSVDLYEDAETFHVIVDLGGIKGDSIDVRVEGNQLIVSGHRPAPRPPKTTGELRVHLMEIDHGAYSRSLEIPEIVDVDVIKATYRYGMLWVILPKKTKP